MSKIIDTDNFGGDYPNERFHLLPLPEKHAQAICDILNAGNSPYAERFFKVVPDDYKLQPGFEP